MKAFGKDIMWLQVLSEGLGHLSKYTLRLPVLLLLLGCAVQVQAGIIGYGDSQNSDTANAWVQELVFDIGDDRVTVTYLLPNRNPLAIIDEEVGARSGFGNITLAYYAASVHGNFDKWNQDAYPTLVQSNVDQLNQDHFLLGVDATLRPDTSLNFSAEPMVGPQDQKNSAISFTKKGVVLVMLIATPLLLLAGAALGFVSPKLGIHLAILWIVFWMPIENILYEVLTLLGDALG